MSQDQSSEDFPQPQQPEEADAERLREDQLDEAAAERSDTQSQGRPAGDDEPGGDDAPDGSGHASGERFSGAES